jgi:spermidine synthase
MFAMGVGSYVTKWLGNRLVVGFVVIEIAIPLFGGLSSTLLFLVFPFRVFYEPVMYTLIIAIGALMGMEIPILTRVLSERSDLCKSIAHVLSLDYFGALIGSVSFPLLLLAYLGLFRSSCAGRSAPSTGSSSTCRTLTTSRSTSSTASSSTACCAGAWRLTG